MLTDRRRLVPFLLAFAGYAFAGVTVPLLLLFAGGWWLPKTVDAGPHLSTVPSVVIDVLLLALFGLQHSGMARPSFKAFVTRWVPEALERTVYIVDGQPGRVGAVPGLAAAAATDLVVRRHRRGGARRRVLARLSCWSTRPPCC